MEQRRRAPLLALDSVTCGYDGRVVVRGASLRLYPGLLAVLVGPIASGKTTLLRCIAGMIDLYDGRITLGELDLSRLDSRSRARLVAYVPQEAPAVNMKALDVVVLGRLPHITGLSPSREDYEIAMSALKLLGIEGLADRRVSELSGGQRRLVYIARALAQQPRVLLLDEPTSGLDVGTRWSVLKKLRRLVRDSGIIALVTTHDVSLAPVYADYIYVLSGGRIVARFDANTIDTGILSRVYGVEIASVILGGKRFLLPVPRD